MLNNRGCKIKLKRGCGDFYSLAVERVPPFTSRWEPSPCFVQVLAGSVADKPVVVYTLKLIDNMLSKLLVQVVQTHNIQLHGCEIRHKYGCGDIYGWYLEGVVSNPPFTSTNIDLHLKEGWIKCMQLNRLLLKWLMKYVVHATHFYYTTLNCL